MSRREKQGLTKINKIMATILEGGKNGRYQVLRPIPLFFAFRAFVFLSLNVHHHSSVKNLVQNMVSFYRENEDRYILRRVNKKGLSQ